jgi:hypothetical protein
MVIPIINSQAIEWLCESPAKGWWNHSNWAKNRQPLRSDNRVAAANPDAKKETHAQGRKEHQGR